MANVLTVDDSRAVRLIVCKQVRDLGLDVEEAEDGEQALAKLQSQKYDLVVLDVTMPVLDGPGMLAKLRERGDKTPVLMLTSESKRSIVAGLLKLGIADYILKPFKADELQDKVRKILNLGAGSAKGTSAEAGAGATAGASDATDVLVVDDMENVEKRLRTLLPERHTTAAALNVQAAFAICRERTFRAVLVDYDLPEVNMSSFVKQLRVLQPNAVVLAMPLRAANNVQDEARAAGFDGLLFKPFDQAGIEDFLGKYFDNQEMVQRDENVLRVAPFKGRESRLPSYFVQVSSVATKAADEIAAACFGELILDISQVPPVPEKTTRLVLDVSERAKKVGLELRLVGSPEVAGALRQLADTADIPMFSSVNEAMAGA